VDSCCVSYVAHHGLTVICLSHLSSSCSFWAPVPSSSDGKVTASVPGRITAAAASSGGRSSSSIPAPYSFAAVAAAGPSGTPAESDVGGRCAKVFVAVQPSNPKTRVLGPAGALTGSLVPAAGKLVCGDSNSFRFSGNFGPLETDATSCGEHQVWLRAGCLFYCVLRLVSLLYGVPSLLSGSRMHVMLGLGPAGALTGSLVPAAGKLVCGDSKSFRFSGNFGPLGSDATGCGEHQVGRLAVHIYTYVKM
jgi:hypothetical protein